MVSLLLAAPAAVAQETGDRDIAKGHFEAGRGYYARGAFDKALHEFQAAYDLTGLADLQYNIAQCHERLFEPDKALAAYRLYLANGKPTEQDRGFVESRIALLDREIERRRAGSAAAPEGPPPAAGGGGRPAGSPRASGPPAVQAAPGPAAAPTIELSRPPQGPDAWYRNAWIWGAAGGVALGAVIAILAARGGGDEPEPIYRGRVASLPIP